MSGGLHSLAARAAPDLGTALGLALAELLPPDSPLGRRLGTAVPFGTPPPALFEAALGRRDGPDSALLAVARRLGLPTPDLAAVALAAELERNPVVPAALRAIQGESFGPWPSLATLARLLERLGQADAAPLPDLARAVELGFLVRLGERVPAAEERFALAPILLAALGLPSLLPGLRRLAAGPVPDSWRAEALRHAACLKDRTALMLRQGDRGDKRLYAAHLAAALGREAVEAPMDTAGLGPAAEVAGWLPVETVEIVAGERRALAPLPGYAGPRLIVTGPEGGLHADAWDILDLPLPPVSPAERARLWAMALPGSPAAARHAATRIGPARLAAAAARATDGADRLRAAMGAEYRADMEPHARLVPQDATRDDFIADAGVTRELGILLARCRHRACPGNPVPGVRALLSGPSGTGKTLAAQWIATELDLPLFKLDLSTIVSKYIGETEENLARILDRAETGDMVLLMDEADSLFAKRTETRDSSDRFANNQTNYLLSRIETFDGIAILTSNTPERFDTAFARRLDQVIEVPLPAAPERRRIWRLHLRDASLTPGELNRLAGLVDLAGGHIRNIAQTARVIAAAEARAIGFPDLALGVALECRKLGRPPPAGLDR